MPTKYFRTCQVAVALGASLLAQAGPGSTRGDAPEKSLNVATAIIEFKDDPSSPNLPASSVLEFPMQCAANGRVFAEIVQPNGLPLKRLYSISATEIHEFDEEKITDLHDVSVRGYYPAESGVVLLIRGKRKSRPGKMAIVSPDGSKTEVDASVGEFRSYLAEFDSNGSFERMIELDESLAVAKIGVFDSGNFLLFGFVRSSGLPKLEILGADGKVLSILDPPKAIEDWSRTLRAQDDVSPVSLLHIPPSQLAPSNGNIIFVATGSPEVLEISPGGGLRTVRLKLPADLSIDSLIPSSGYWYARIRASETSTKSAEETASTFKLRIQPVVYELDPANGQVVRRIDTSSVPPPTIACVYDDRFVAFRWDKGKFVRVLGEVTH